MLEIFQACFSEIWSWMGFFRYSNTFWIIEFDFLLRSDKYGKQISKFSLNQKTNENFKVCFRYLLTFRALGILKEQIEDKKYFFEWDSNPQKYMCLQGKNRKILRSVFGSNENRRICFRDYLTFSGLSLNWFKTNLLWQILTFLLFLGYGPGFRNSI